MIIAVSAYGRVAEAGAVIDGMIMPADPAHQYLRPALALLVTLGGGAMMVYDAPDAVLLT